MYKTKVNLKNLNLKKKKISSVFKIIRLLVKV